MNAVKHATPKEVCIRLTYGRARTTLVVLDDGQGFAADDAERPGRVHFGLDGMQERALGIGAALDIRSSPGDGTRVRLRIPTLDSSPRTTRQAG